MAWLIKAVSTAPPDRLALVVAVVFIVSLMAAVKALWARTEKHERELEQIYELHHQLLGWLLEGRLNDLQATAVVAEPAVTERTEFAETGDDAGPGERGAPARKPGM